MELLVLGFTDGYPSLYMKPIRLWQCCRGGHFPTMVKGTMQFLNPPPRLDPKVHIWFSK